MSQQDQALERDLRELLGRERPNAEEFEATVERKLAKLKEEGAEPAPYSIAADVLPPLVLAHGSLFGQQALAKVASVLSFPFTLVGVLFFLIGHGMRTVRGLEGERSASKAAMERAGRWLAGNWMWGLVWAGLAFYVGRFGDLDAAFAVVVLSVGAIVYLLRGLSKEGVASRRVVSQSVTQVLYIVFMAGVLQTGFHPTWPDLVLFFAYMTTVGICALLSRSDHSPDIEPGRYSRRDAILVGACFLPVVVVFAAFYGKVAARGAASVEDIGRWAEVEAQRADPDWALLADAVQLLKRVDAPVPSLSNAKAAFASLSDVRARMNCRPAWKLGLIDLEEFATLAREATAGSLILGSAHVAQDPSPDSAPIPALDLFKGSYAAGLVDLLHAGELTPDELSSVTDELDRALQAGLSLTVRECASMARVLNALGREDLIDRLKPVAEAALRRVWVEGSGRMRPGGFAYEPGENSASPAPTLLAAEVMTEFGTPEFVDVKEVHRLLHSRLRLTTADPETRFWVDDAVGFRNFELDYAAELPSGLVATIWSLRLLIGGLAICGMCIFAVLGAPIAGKDR